jgi:pantoate--beta-alanine ligase
VTAGPLVCRTREELATARDRLAGGQTAVVMTMGALHAGHAALIRAARRRAAHVVVTVFLNPLQFGPKEDLSRYPRTFESDLQICESEGVDVVFAPTPDVVYPGGEPGVRVSAGPLGDVLEGASRPGHFDGVLTVVAKLLGIVGPQFVLFGQKDAQQVFLVQRMVRDLDIPTRVDVVETVRAADGLALSSRNRYLDDDARRAALALSRALEAAASSGDRGIDAVLAAAQSVLMDEELVKLDYLKVVDPRTFLPVDDGYKGPARVIIAAKVGETRLIDNDSIYLN